MPNYDYNNNNNHGAFIKWLQFAKSIVWLENYWSVQFQTVSTASPAVCVLHDLKLIESEKIEFYSNNCMTETKRTKFFEENKTHTYEKNISIFNILRIHTTEPFKNDSNRYIFG